MTSDPVARFFRRKRSRTARTAWLRPMSTEDVTNLGLRIYREHGWAFLRLAFLPALGFLGAIAFILEYTLPSLGFTNSPDSLSKQVGESAVTMLISALVAVPLMVASFCLISALAVRVTSDSLLAKSPDVGAAWSDAKLAMPRLFGTMIRESLLALSGIGASAALMFGGGLLAASAPSGEWVSGLVAFVGVLGLVAGGVFFARTFAVHALITPVAILEGSSGKRAGERSAELMKAVAAHGSGVPPLLGMFAFVALVALLLLLGSSLTFGLAGLSALVEGVTMGLPLQNVLLYAIDLLPTYLVIWTLAPVIGIWTTIIYYDRRIRREGFDIEVLAHPA